MHTTAAGVQTKTPGGFLALDSNSGSWDRDRFSLIPALEFELGYELNSGWRAVVGYNLMYWTNVLRASEQIDSTINADKLQPIQPGTGPERPSVPFKESDYLAHEISFLNVALNPRSTAKSPGRRHTVAVPIRRAE